MCIKKFMDMYGMNTTTNFDLLRWGKQLGITELKVLMKNELRRTILKNKLPLYVICNYQSTKDNGSHWVAMVVTNSSSFYFDSYGIQPFPEAVEFLVGGVKDNEVNGVNAGVYSTFRIQPDNTKMCGQLCLYLLYKMSQGHNFYDIVLELNDYFNK